ncbi:MAG: GTPase Era [Alphaproteobacteria bacterium ADurb.Bin438]|nr:MAG: GTPase Era [Alphaproteobacteria bacterium ADurb.Bin438]
MNEADEVVVVVDALRKNDPETDDIIEALGHKQIKAILLLNKVDRADKQRLLNLAKKLFDTGVFKEVFMVSAMNGEGVEDFKNKIKSLMPEGPFYYDEDQITDMPLRMFASEVVREKLFLNLREELPYSLTVETDNFKEEEKGIRIEMTIYVEKEGQKKIILGKNGSFIKKIGQSARLELQEILESKVNLFLFVKVKENWQEDKTRYTSQGLKFD